MSRKKKKPWPDPPASRIVDCFSGSVSIPHPTRDIGRAGETGRDMYGWGIENPSPTVCKHGEGSCEECGTTNRRDMPHTTVGGRGAVGRLFKR